MTIKLITSPQFRDDIRISFEELADQELQMKEWIRKGAAHRYWDSLKMYVFHTIYDDHDLHEEDPENIGDLFYDEAEAQAIHQFSKWFDELTDGIGWEEPDSSYLKHPEWPKVWEGASKIATLMAENDQKYNIHASWDAWNKKSP